MAGTPKRATKKATRKPAATEDETEEIEAQAVVDEAEAPIIESLALEELPEPGTVPEIDVEDVGVLTVGEFDYKIDADFGLAQRHEIQRVQALSMKYSHLLQGAAEGREKALTRAFEKDPQLTKLLHFEADLTDEIMARIIDANDRSSFTARYSGKYADGSRVPKSDRIEQGEIMVGLMALMAGGRESNPKT